MNVVNANEYNIDKSGMKLSMCPNGQGVCGYVRMWKKEKEQRCVCVSMHALS